MTITTKIKDALNDVRAWRRGERRVAPSGCRGRVYERAAEALPAGEGPSDSAGPRVVETKTAYRTLARVIRADGRPDEHFDLSAGGKKLTAEQHHVAVKGN